MKTLTCSTCNVINDLAGPHNYYCDNCGADLAPEATDVDLADMPHEQEPTMIYSPTTAAQILSGTASGITLGDAFEAGILTCLRIFLNEDDINVEMLAEHLADDLSDIFAQAHLNEYVRGQEA